MWRINTCRPYFRDITNLEVAWESSCGFLAWCVDVHVSAVSICDCMLARWDKKNVKSSQQPWLSSSLPSRQSSSPSHFHRARMHRWLWHRNSSLLHLCGSEAPLEASGRNIGEAKKIIKNQPQTSYFLLSMCWGVIIGIAIIAHKRC